MNYLEYNIQIEPYNKDNSEIIVAMLAETGFDSFVDTETGLLAYIPENLHSPIQIEDVFARVNTSIKITSSIKNIAQQNWNALWESNFEPIFINNTIAVLAPFHQVSEKYKYEILIEPKMSFGTGHHETTSLMMSQMLDIDFAEKKVLDMGSGTGILAILASKLGAKEVAAIDNDEWAFKNCLENFEHNNCAGGTILLGDASSIPGLNYNIVLANINRNILVNDIHIYQQHLLKNGLLLLSGFYTEDLQCIEKECNINMLFLQKTTEKNRWMSALFIKGS